MIMRLVHSSSCMLEFDKEREAGHAMETPAHPLNTSHTTGLTPKHGSIPSIMGVIILSYLIQSINHDRHQSMPHQPASRSPLNYLSLPPSNREQPPTSGTAVRTLKSKPSTTQETKAKGKIIAQTASQEPTKKSVLSPPANCAFPQPKKQKQRKEADPAHPNFYFLLCGSRAVHPSPRSVRVQAKKRIWVSQSGVVVGRCGRKRRNDDCSLCRQKEIEVVEMAGGEVLMFVCRVRGAMEVMRWYVGVRPVSLPLMTAMRGLKVRILSHSSRRRRISFRAPAHTHLQGSSSAPSSYSPYHSLPYSCPSGWTSSYSHYDTCYPCRKHHRPQ